MTTREPDKATLNRMITDLKRVPRTAETKAAIEKLQAQLRTVQG